MNIANSDIQPDCAYRFHKVKLNESGISVIFKRHAGRDTQQEGAPATLSLSVLALRDFFEGNIGRAHDIVVNVDDKYFPLYEKQELRKGIDAVSDLPRDVLKSDMFVQNYFRNPHYWPFQKWGYEGPTPL